VHAVKIGLILLAALSFAYAQDTYAQNQGASPGPAAAKPADKQPEGSKPADKQPAVPKPGDKQPASPKPLVRRLEAVTWNPVRSELTWMVTAWDFETSTREPAAKERYTMHLDAAVMEADGELRRFDTAEARRVRILMDVISTYAVESTVWWDSGVDASLDGQVVPLPDDDKTKPPAGPGEGKASRDKEEKDKPKPAPKMLPGPKAVLDIQPLDSGVVPVAARQ
jgi:hypothetical protein